MNSKSIRETLYPDAPTVRQYLEKHFPDDITTMARGLQPASPDDFILVDTRINAFDQYACSMSNGETFSFMFWVDNLDRVVYFYAPPEWNTGWRRANDLRDKS